MLSVKQGGVKYHFLSLWYDSTWDWTQVSQAIGKYSYHYANVRKVKLATVVEGDQKAPFKVFGMTRTGIEPWSPGPSANTLLTGPMCRRN